MSRDFTAITETPGTLLSPDQRTRKAQRYRRAAALAADGHVLEVSCGAGCGLGYLARHARAVVGLDYTATVLSLARSHYGSRIPLVQGDAQQLPFPTASFDLVFCFEAIYYLPDQARFLSESRRVLTAGGRLLICQSNPDWPDFVPGPLTTHYPPVPTLTQAIAEAGFHDIVCHASLPVTRGRRRWASRLRRYALRSGLVERLGPLVHLLKAVSYGDLVSLPAELDPGTVAAWTDGATLTPIPADQPDRVHRVVYAQAHA